MSLSKYDKLRSGVFLILNDYASGKFPPVFTDPKVTHDAEIAIRETLKGTTAEEITNYQLRKPFCDIERLEGYLKAYCKLSRSLESLSVRAPAKLLELGCGEGWMAELLAIAGFDVTGTSISPHEICDARKRIESLHAKGLQTPLRFEVSAMESVAETLGTKGHFDAVFVFEALHHAFDWPASLRSSYTALKPGGWLLLCEEPNLLHTFRSYRVARLSNTHEIGFSKRELIAGLREAGFKNIISAGDRLHWWAKPLWLFAQK